jgi:2-iminobutanoate/2-iminopropanoate deaminase
VRGPERWLYIAGTMGLSQDGSAPKTLAEQLELIWANIRTILAEANMTTDNIVRLTSYLSDPSYAAANGAARERALGSRRIPTTAIVVQTLDPTWLVEIEAIAVA